MAVRSSFLIPQRSRDETALLISTYQKDHEILDSVFRERGWTLYSARSTTCASAILQQNPGIRVVFTEQDLSGEGWKDVLGLVSGMADPPPLIVVSSVADDRLWAEALNLGAYDVLAKPFDAEELVRVLQSAWDRGRTGSAAE